MLSTALAIQDATKEAVYDDSVIEMASDIYKSRHDVTQDEFIRMIYIYSAHLSALTASLVTHACLTESQMDEMMNSIREIEELGEEITNGNND